MIKIYISGKITGDLNYRQKFLNAENKLFDALFEPYNPAALVSANAKWNDAMRIAIKLMLNCDGVALLPDWKKSKGAKIEERLARDIGMHVKTLDQWLLGKPTAQ